MRSPRYCWSFLARTPDSTADVLSQLIQDVSATADMRENYTFTTRWVSIIDDLSGIDGEWEALSTNPEKLMASPVAEILKMSGKYHLPLLHANAEALDKGEQYFSFDINGTAFKREAHERHSPCLLACLLACLPACPAKTLCRLIQRIKGSASNRA